MAKYVSEGGIGDFQPMNANFGVVAPLDRKVKGGKRARNQALAERALDAADRYAEQIKNLRKGV